MRLPALFRKVDFAKIGSRFGRSATLKLYNKTRLSNAIIEPLLTAAGRCVGAKTANVIVKVTQGRWRGVSGMAHMAAFCYAWHLKRCTLAGRKRLISTDGGWFSITIPAPHPECDQLAIARQVFEVAMHEWVHIRDYQAGGCWRMPFASRGPSGRRPRHDRRPEELRAINAVDEALDRGAVQRYQDVIIALAIEQERLTRAASASL